MVTEGRIEGLAGETISPWGKTGEILRSFLVEQPNITRG